MSLFNNNNNNKMNITIFGLMLMLCLVAYVQGGRIMPGGLADESPADDEVRRVVDDIKDRGLIDEKTKLRFKTIKPISYRKQVVAGANYFIRAIAEEEKTNSEGERKLVKHHIHLRVYRPFRGGLELTAIRTGLDEKDRLEYFQ